MFARGFKASMRLDLRAGIDVRLCVLPENFSADLLHLSHAEALSVGKRPTDPTRNR
jgi:hypothetical protein